MHPQVFKNLCMHLHYGKVTTSQKYPFMAFIHYDNIFICGGTLIAPNWVMTAAHCVNNFLKYGPVGLSLTFGCNNIFEEKKYSVKLNKILIHEKFTENSLKNDIALLKLETNIPSQYAIPVEIPSFPLNVTDLNAIIIGWGKTENRRNIGYLRCGNVTITSCPWFLNSDFNKICALVSKKSLKTVTDFGDSGGAVILPKETGMTQIGIICSEWESFIAPNTKCCLFTDVTKYLDWIRLKLLYQ